MESARSAIAVPSRLDMTQTLAIIHEEYVKVFENVQRVILGKELVIERVLTAMAARGHVLLKDVPGTGKTMLARTIAATIACAFKRIQFVPDLLPMDITGSNVFDLRKKAFDFQPGPVFTNILLADEINRATPKTQSALLEVMEERQVSVEGVTHKLDAPFQVLATMNPLDHDGTYALPAAQMDRFLMMLSVGYPPQDAEVRMLDVHLAVDPVLEDIRPVIDRSQFLRWQQTVPLVFCSDDIKRYAVGIANALRSDSQNLQSISPRSTLGVMRAAQARAMLSGRDYVSVEDLQTLAPDVYSHRVLVADARVGREFIQEVISRVPAPV
ncbi:MAG: MoxR family ATPase [Deltaproteobacteria bacterium]|nr:MoxR family ATPase [Deltaproteobacteria bacterium]